MVCVDEGLYSLEIYCFLMSVVCLWLCNFVCLGVEPCLGDVVELFATVCNCRILSATICKCETGHMTDGRRGPKLWGSRVRKGASLSLSSGSGA